MRTNQLKGDTLEKFQNTYNAGYGYGLGVRTMLDLARGGANNSVGSFGWSGMLGTWTEIDPSEGLSIVYMHQTTPNYETEHHHRVRAAAYSGLK
jgi:CubicO group peptidase (beta-lactamase class C family)